jgi:hypothetical protein
MKIIIPEKEKENACRKLSVRNRTCEKNLRHLGFLVKRGDREADHSEKQYAQGRSSFL